MRTKTLLGLAALAVGLTSSMAQVYSLNVVGYVNVPLTANKLSFISVPLTPNGGSFDVTNTVVLDDSQDGAIIYKWAGTKWDDNQATWFAGTGWYSPAPMVIPAGTGFFLSPVANSTLTFVGEVPQGTQSYNVPTGMSILANQVPDGANFPGGTIGHDSDMMYLWDVANQKWSDNSWTYFDGTGWYGGPGSSTNGPALAPASAVFYQNSGTAIPFTRSFTVQ